MKKNVLLSIIVPIYNVEKYIGSLVNSLVKQTNKNFEVIFIDDGSTDESMQILKEIMAGTTLKTFAERLTGGEVLDLAAQLP
ncbi:glycosyltransferase, partial [Micromonospora sp. NPDC005599]|uniref:glycosyltransferase family 2 protein n=1 Tax=Micromonospora sp. NPDC005599 TaxID=3155715 RepID=UPI0033BE8B77